MSVFRGAPLPSLRQTPSQPIGDSHESRIACHWRLIEGTQCHSERRTFFPVTRSMERLLVSRGSFSVGGASLVLPTNPSSLFLFATSVASFLLNTPRWRYVATPIVSRVLASTGHRSSVCVAPLTQSTILTIRSLPYSKARANAVSRALRSFVAASLS